MKSGFRLKILQLYDFTLSMRRAMSSHADSTWCRRGVARPAPPSVTRRDSVSGCTAPTEIAPLRPKPNPVLCQKGRPTTRSCDGCCEAPYSPSHLQPVIEELSQGRGLFKHIPSLNHRRIQHTFNVVLDYFFCAALPLGAAEKDTQQT